MPLYRMLTSLGHTPAMIKSIKHLSLSNVELENVPENNAFWIKAHLIPA